MKIRNSRRRDIRWAVRTSAANLLCQSILSVEQTTKTNQNKSFINAGLNPTPLTSPQVNRRKIIANIEVAIPAVLCVSQSEPSHGGTSNVAPIQEGSHNTGGLFVLAPARSTVEKVRICISPRACACSREKNVLTIYTLYTYTCTYRYIIICIYFPPHIP